MAQSSAKKRNGTRQPLPTEYSVDQQEFEELANLGKGSVKPQQIPMTQWGKGEDRPSRFETAFGTMVSPNTAIEKHGERQKPSHSRKPTWPEESAFSQNEYAEYSGCFEA